MPGSPGVAVETTRMPKNPEVVLADLELLGITPVTYSPHRKEEPGVGLGLPYGKAVTSGE